MKDPPIRRGPEILGHRSRRVNGSTEEVTERMADQIGLCGQGRFMFGNFWALEGVPLLPGRYRLGSSQRTSVNDRMREFSQFSVNFASQPPLLRVSQDSAPSANSEEVVEVTRLLERSLKNRDVSIWNRYASTREKVLVRQAGHSSCQPQVEVWLKQLQLPPSQLWQDLSGQKWQFRFRRVHHPYFREGSSSPLLSITIRFIDVRLFRKRYKIPKEGCCVDPSRDEELRHGGQA